SLFNSTLITSWPSNINLIPSVHSSLRHPLSPHRRFSTLNSSPAAAPPPAIFLLSFNPFFSQLLISLIGIR
ncbi:hypothetical protein AKJ16_DCAP07953, partial [Drosera capensis]